MNSIARFLLLTDAAPCLRLLDGEHRLLGEVIEDDGFIVDGLMRHAAECPPPAATMLATLVPPPSPGYPVRCFALTSA
jgi:hypothetical protein